MNEIKEEPILVVEGKNNLRYIHYVHLLGITNKIFNMFTLISGLIFVIIGTILAIGLNNPDMFMLPIMIIIAGALLILLFLADYFLIPIIFYKNSKKEENRLEFYSDRIEFQTNQMVVPLIRIKYDMLKKIEEYKGAYYFYTRIGRRIMAIAFLDNSLTSENKAFLKGLMK